MSSRGSSHLQTAVPQGRAAAMIFVRLRITRADGLAHGSARDPRALIAIDEEAMPASGFRFLSHRII
jgi:hypothetical protein